VLVAFRGAKRGAKGSQASGHGAVGEAPGSRRRRDLLGREQGPLVRLGQSRLRLRGKRLRRKVSGKTKTEVKDKLRELHSDLDAGVQTSASYAVDQAVADWMREGRDGRSPSTLRRDERILRPVR
jgi:hypothetical protein